MSVPAKRERKILPPGTILEDRFQIVDLLGAGNFGAVYLARQLVFGHTLREVALKLFESDAVSASNMHDVFNDGIRLVSLQESSPQPEIARHLIQVYDIGVVKAPEPKAFMSMKVAGYKNLSSVVRRFRDGVMPVETSLRFLRQILVPLAWMHTLEDAVVHGDLHPGNILLTGESDAVIADFGLAARLPLGTLGGAISYQAPETLLGQPGLAASDAYGVGIIWYELLTGRHPFQDVGLEALAANDSRAFLIAHQQARKWPIRPAEPGEEVTHVQRIPPASEINEDLRNHPQLEALLNRCFAYFPTQRFANARLLLHEIDEYLKTGSLSSAIVAPVDVPPSETTPPTKTPAMLVSDSDSLRQQGRHAEALQRAEVALQLDRNCVPAWLATARAFIALGKIDEARDACAKAQALAARDPDVFEALADVYQAEKKSGLADNLRKQAAGLRAQNRHVRRNL